MRWISESVRGTGTQDQSWVGGEEGHSYVLQDVPRREDNNPTHGLFVKQADVGTFCHPSEKGISF